MTSLLGVEEQRRLARELHMNKLTILLQLSALAVGLAASTQSADAEKLTYSCNFLDGSKGGRYSSSVNQMIVDLDATRLLLRAAQSLGTSQPIEYSFQNQDEDRLIISSTPNGLTIAAIRFGTPQSLFLNSETGILVWQYPDGDVPEHSRFKCTR